MGPGRVVVGGRDDALLTESLLFFQIQGQARGTGSSFVWQTPSRARTRRKVASRPGEAISFSVKEEVEVSQDHLRAWGEPVAPREALCLGLPPGLPPRTPVGITQTRLGTDSWGMEGFLGLFMRAPLILINYLLWAHRQTGGTG